MASSFKWYGPEVKKALMEALSAAVYSASWDLRDRIKRLMGPPGPSRPSAKGHPPNRQTSKYYNSIRHSSPRIDKMNASSSVYTNDFRVLIFEDSSGRIYRPHFKLVEKSPSVHKMIVKEVTRTTKRYF